MAAQAGVRYSIENPFAYEKSNMLGTLNIFEFARNNKIKSVVYASSSSVYGNEKELPFKESQKLDTPISLYAATKKANELYAHVYHHLFNINMTGLRFFTVYGPWGRPDMALFKFTDNIIKDKPIEVYNNGEMKRDFTYVDDIVSGVVASIDKEYPFEVFNLARGECVELNDFISEIELNLNKNAKRILMPMQQGDVPETSADTNKAKILLGYEPKTSVKQGINNFISWYNDYYGLNKMKAEEFKVCVVGLGYVGLPLALALAKKFSVYGFDINKTRIEELIEGIDKNKETLGEDLKNSTITFSSSPEVINKCNFIIVAVPTPVDKANNPDFKPLESSSEIVGKNLKKESIVVFESTVYPGATEEVCVPVIEKESGLKCGTDWKIGYSPERINPGDLKHTVNTITKIVSGMDEESLEKIAFIYSQITNVYKASSIKVAEAAKVIENTQRDLNIALVNELSLIFKKMDIDTLEVLEAAGTKWNFLPFRPGLVGGHCIGVDPYYLTYKAEKLGYHPQVILAGRRINDSMALEVVRLAVLGLNKNKKSINGSKILILGATFKENVKDARNSKIKDIIDELESLGAEVILNDPLFEDQGYVKFEGENRKITKLEEIDKTNSENNINNINKINKLDAVIIAVSHKEYQNLSEERIRSWMDNPLIIDVKGILKKDKDILRL